MSKKILLADDHMIVLNGMRSLLKDMENVEVVSEARDGLEAVHLARKFHPDLVIMDISMPHLNGIDATRKIISENSKTKVIALSMHSEWAYVASMLEAGASGYLLKNCAFDELQRAIKTVLENRIYISDGISGKAHKDAERNPFEDMEGPGIAFS